MVVWGWGVNRRGGGGEGANKERGVNKGGGVKMLEAEEHIRPFRPLFVR